MDEPEYKLVCVWGNVRETLVRRGLSANISLCFSFSSVNMSPSGKGGGGCAWLYLAPRNALKERYQIRVEGGKPDGDNTNRADPSTSSADIPLFADRWLDNSTAAGSTSPVSLTWRRATQKKKSTDATTTPAICFLSLEPSRWRKEKNKTRKPLWTRKPFLKVSWHARPVPRFLSLFKKSLVVVVAFSCKGFPGWPPATQPTPYIIIRPPFFYEETDF